ncbi:MAG: Mpv17/PMP22 family protein [Bacteroidetes bacterium]|nr:Mpv17/PMP22 family protein [Bacteroidota bacterium]MCL1968891.1 Mpv17/PMP22 family protein [Bacteroidota bacterium]MCL1969006.1 Mpv17/PMP22 family protein [Bacteroidota bacterium]
MRKQDIIVLICSILFFVPFFICQQVYDCYEEINQHYPLLMAFLKFAVLSTFGEVLGLRIRTGKYYMPNFGILPRAVVWGVLGMWIAMMMGIFRNGVPAYLDKFQLFSGINAAMIGNFSLLKLCGAFCISVVMNTTFAPVFMTLHKITDTHIMQTGGTLKGFFTKKISFTQIITSLNWKVQWKFVFKKTIPLFWIPAHTLTFVLPPDFQVLFAAFLGVCLGVILSVAARKND